jgi:hypothetical protein
VQAQVAQPNQQHQMLQIWALLLLLLLQWLN